MKFKNAQRQGFTLVEIMIIVAIIGLIMASTMPSFIRARERTQQNMIVSNLRVIQAAKDMWALELGKSTTAVPAETDIQVYMEQNTFPTPLAGETYSIEAIGTAPYADLATPLEGMTRIYGVN